MVVPMYTHYIHSSTTKAWTQGVKEGLPVKGGYNDSCYLPWSPHNWQAGKGRTNAMITTEGGRDGGRRGGTLGLAPPSKWLEEGEEAGGGGGGQPEVCSRRIARS